MGARATIGRKMLKAAAAPRSRSGSAVLASPTTVAPPADLTLFRPARCPCRTAKSHRRRRLPARRAAITIVGVVNARSGCGGRAGCCHYRGRTPRSRSPGLARSADRPGRPPRRGLQPLPPARAGHRRALCWPLPRSRVRRRCRQAITRRGPGRATGSRWRRAPGPSGSAGHRRWAWKAAEFTANGRVNW